MAGRFLQNSDYAVQAREEILDLLDVSVNDRQETPAKLVIAEKMAISQMKKRLAKRYDTDQLFAPAPDTGDDTRDYFIIMCAIDLTLYHLWTGEAPNRIPETRSARYTDALTWLRDEASSKDGDSDMPQKATEDYPKDYRISSRQPVNHKY